MANQLYVPIIEVRSKRILGFYQLAAAFNFVGIETTVTLSGARVINVIKYTPEKFIGHKQQEWYMAAVFTYDEYRLEQYKGYPEYRGLQDPNIPFTSWSAPASTAALERKFDGPIIKGLETSWT